MDTLCAEISILGLARSNDRELWLRPDPQRRAWQLGAEALALALADAGLTAADLDGLLLSRLPLDQAGRLGVELSRLSWLEATPGEGRFCAPALLRAAQAISRGQARRLALVYANDSRSRRTGYGGRSGPETQYGDVYGFTSPGAWLALAWQRYAGLYGADPRALAALALRARQAAALDPLAVPLPPWREQDYFASPYVAEPLRRADYCLVNDGAVCLIIGPPAAAAPGSRPQVRLKQGACLAMPPGLYMGEDFFYTQARSLLAQLSPVPDPDELLLIYDNFTPNIIFALEGFGLSPQGQGWSQVLAGRFPHLNPGGGLLANSYMQGWNLVHEAVTQLRGQAGARQVGDCKRAWYLCTSAVVGALCLERAEE